MKKLIYHAFIFLTFFPFIEIKAQELFPNINGWRLEINEEVYDANNLWDIIDGAADLYLEYSFEDLHIARYYKDDNTEIKVELYRFKSPLDAFGMYSQEKDLNYKFIEMGVSGYIDNDILNFVTGVYYIKLYSYQVNSETQNNLSLIAKNINEYLKQNNSLPEIYNMFPAKYRIKNSEQYISKNFLGYSFLNSVAIVYYKLPDCSNIKVFLIRNKDQELSETLLTKYLSQNIKGDIKKIDENIFEITISSNDKIIVGAKNKFLFGIVCETKCDNYKSFLGELINNLK
ncbi:MAG: DUF6599 family protein [Candidatus Anstonellales archaeon]